MLRHLSLSLYGVAALLTLVLFLGGEDLPWAPLSLAALASLGAGTILHAHRALRAGRAWWWGATRRGQEPARFWLAVTLTYLVGAGCLASAAVLALSS